MNLYGKWNSFWVRRCWFYPWGQMGCELERLEWLSIFLIESSLSLQTLFHPFWGLQSTYQNGTLGGISNLSEAENFDPNTHISYEFTVLCSCGRSVSANAFRMLWGMFAQERMRIILQPLHKQTLSKIHPRRHSNCNLLLNLTRIASKIHAKAPPVQLLFNSEAEMRFTRECLMQRVEMGDNSGKNNFFYWKFPVIFNWSRKCFSFGIGSVPLNS